MSLPLLMTKFNLPPTGAKIVRRTRLLRILDDSLGQNAPLILVCAPAGYGKTTLISEWLQESPKVSSGRYAWLSLERGDDDLTRFLTYFVSALQRIFPNIGQGVLKLLQTHKPSPIPVLGTLLINELNEISEPFILILDDYHLMTADAVHKFISFLVEHQPQSMCLVLVSRADPALPLPRLRAQGRLVELRQQELCFTGQEAVEYMRVSTEAWLSAEQEAFLARKTEGWITGLQLAVISMRSFPDQSAFFEAFSGNHEFIADYLAVEVLNNLPEQLSTFLLQTSILERISAPLCEAVTGRVGAQQALEQLLDANLFITPMDNQRTWYRYHTLFADLLRKRLIAEMGASLNELHQRASLWYENADMLDLAIEHAITAGDFERAAQLIEQQAESFLKRGEAHTLLRWMKALPKEMPLTRPLLGSLYGFTLILCGKSTEVIDTLLERLGKSGSPGDYQGEMSMFQALLALLRWDAPGTISFAEQALQQLPLECSFFRSLAADSLGMGFMLVGDVPGATRAFEQVVEISSQSENLMMTIMGWTNLAGLQYYQGQLQAAIASCRQVLDLAEANLGSDTPIIGKTLLNLAEIYREQGDFEISLRYFTEAARMLEEFNEIGLPIAYLSIARLKMNRKDWDSAQQTIDQARQLAQSTQATKLDDRLVEVAQVRLWLYRRELGKVIRWAQGRGILDRSCSEWLAELGQRSTINELSLAECLVVIRLYMAKEQPGRAAELVEMLYEVIETRGLKRRQVEILVLKALVLHQMGDSVRAMEFLGRALRIGEPEGYQTTFVDEGEPMAQMLYQAVARNISPSYASRLLAVISEEKIPELEKNLASDELIEALSPRELDVLGLIAEGLTNGEIAERLYISLSTVKGHTANIFGKLNVNNRTQAVARARSLGIYLGT